MSIIFVFIVGVLFGIGGLFIFVVLEDWWKTRKRVSHLDRDKAARLLYNDAVFYAVDMRDESIDHRWGYEYCLSGLFGEDYKDRVCAEAERRWEKRKGARK